MDEEERLHNIDELLEQMKLDDLEGSPKMAPRDWARSRKVTPQLVYYHIRQGHIKAEVCQCGRKVIDAAEADAFWEGQQAKKDKEKPKGYEGQRSDGKAD